MASKMGSGFSCGRVRSVGGIVRRKGRGYASGVFAKDRATMSRPASYSAEPGVALSGNGATTSGVNGSDPLHSALDRKLRVAVDVDEVLGRFLIALNLFCKERYGMDYDVKDYWVYEFAKIWKCSGDKSNQIVHEFFESSHFRSGIPIMPGAQETLQELQTWCDLMVVTSRQHVIEDATVEWLSDHFPGIFSSVHFGNHFACEGVSRKKSTICREIQADVLIDDNPIYAKDCASNGIEVVLYDWAFGYPWSKLPAGMNDPKIRVVSNWAEVREALEKIRMPESSLAKRL